MSARVLGLLLLLASGTALAQPDFPTPSRPRSPTTRKECDALDQQWKEIRKRVAAQHTACLDENENCRADKGGECTCAACERYHDPDSLGREDVQWCKDTVREVEKQRLREEAERRRREEEQQRQREAARRQEEKRRREDKSRREKEAEAERQQRDVDAMLLEMAAESSRHEKEMLRHRTEERERKREELERESERAAEQAAEAHMQAEQHRDEASRLASQLGDVLASNTGSSSQDLTSDFDLSAVGGEVKQEQDGLSWFMEAGKLFALPPAASMPFALFENSIQATQSAMDKTMFALENFERLDPRFAEDVVHGFSEDLLGPRQVTRLLLNEVLGGAATHLVSKHGLEPALEAVSERAAHALEAKTPAALFQEPPSSVGPQPRVFHWWTYGPGSESKVLRDDHGVPLLFDRQGKLFRYDSATGKAGYGVEDVERLVAKHGLLLRSERESEWRENVTIFLPGAEEEESALREKLAEFAAGKLAGPALESLLDKTLGKEKP